MHQHDRLLATQRFNCGRHTVTALLQCHIAKLVHLQKENKQESNSNLKMLLERAHISFEREVFARGIGTR